LITPTAWPQLWQPPGAMGWVLPHVAEVNMSHIVLFAALGLVIGSFLNVLIYRLPLMILQTLETEAAAFNLTTPGSHCPQCQHLLHWYELIPVLSYS